MCVLKRSYGQMVADGLVPGPPSALGPVAPPTTDQRVADPVSRTVPPVPVAGGWVGTDVVAVDPVPVGADPGR